MSESHKASIGVNIPLNPDQEEAVRLRHGVS